MLKSGLGILLAALLLSGCDDPEPGLKDEARIERVTDCQSVVGKLAKTAAKADALCECLTGRLAAQRLTIDDLSGAKQDRAMEQLRWCGVQVGVFPKSTPSSVSSSSPEPENESPEPAESEAPATGENE